MVTKINSPITPLEQTEKTNEIIDDLNDKLYRAELNGIRSNCITEIPQNIKMELNNGIVTLKAGSKVYVPNGAGVFNAVTIDSDKTYTGGWNDVRMLCYNGHSLDGYPVSQTFSGPSAPSGQQYMMWYDTTNNIIKWTADGGSTWTDQWSLPVCIVTGGTGVVNSIDQIFNGFGYIGSTVFALPGVKGLVPDGRNADGTLKNIEFTLESVKTFTDQYFTDGELVFGINALNINNAYYSGYKYNGKENFIVYNNTVWRFCYFAKYTAENGGKITSFTPKTSFNALDYNDKGTIAGWAMPSNKHIDLTLGASGATYTAPANGFINLIKQAQDGENITLVNNTGSYLTVRKSCSSAGNIAGFIPVKNGDVCTIAYTASGSVTSFTFVYAEGEV